MTGTTAKFPVTMRLMHWSMAALLLSMLCAGAVMVDSLATWQPALLTMHKSFGVVALFLVFPRLLVRLTSAVPALPSSLPPLQKLAATLSHYFLYVLMFALPVTGLLMQYNAARPVDFFCVASLPAALSTNIEAFALYRVSHGYLALALIVVVGVHVSAALYHHFVRKDDVLKSML
ncbi:MAG: cytochrome b [Alteromonadaceae bacterium]|nr:cytochrome b [Alteromonadaceae bacterium]